MTAVPRGRAALVLATAVPLLVTGCSAAAPPAAPAAGAAPTAATAARTTTASAVDTTALPAPAGFTVALETTEEPTAGAGGAAAVRWTADWVLAWAPVAGATSYDVYFVTSEGGAAGARPRRTTAEPRLRLQAAAGTSAPERVAAEREAGLLLTSSQLLVAVAAHAEGKQAGVSPWFPVGDVPADRVPLPAG